MNTLKNFVEASYKKKGDSTIVNGMILDNELSTRRNKVYVDPNTGKATHVIAGTDNLKDWANNLLIPFGLHQYTNRYKNSEETQKKANEKYGKENVDLVTHSQSGNIAQNLQKRNLVGGDNTTLNPAIVGSHDKNIKVVKSRLDPVSLLTKTNKNDVIYKESSYNPLTEHSTAILEGKGLKKKIYNNLNMKEQELIKRMAKLSHDLHINGPTEDLLKAYKLIGHGILTHKSSGKGFSLNDFNSWTKSVGQKFKPLMKYVNPVLEAGTNKLINTITGNPFGSVEFKDEKKIGKNEKRRMKAREEQEYQDARKREQDEYEYSRPRRSSRYDDYDEDEYDYSPPPRRRGRPKKYDYDDYEVDLPQVPQKRVEPQQQEQQFYGFNNQPSSYQRYSGNGLKKKMLGKGTGKKLGANLGRNLGVLADAGTNKLVNMIGTGTGTKLGANLGRNLGTLADAGTNKLVKMIGTGTGTKLGANLGRNLGTLADAGTNKLVNMIGTGRSCGGRLVKGSPEAKAHMAAIRAKRKC